MMQRAQREVAWQGGGEPEGERQSLAAVRLQGLFAQRRLAQCGLQHCARHSGVCVCICASLCMHDYLITVPFMCECMNA